MPVPRSAAPEIEPPAERLPARPVPVPEELPREEELPAEEEAHDPRAAAAAVASVASEAVAHAHAHAADSGATGGKKALVQYDYEKAEDNEIELREGEYVTNIEMVDDDWWMGTNARGESGLFPSNYVELVDDNEEAAAAPPPAPIPAPAPAPALVAHEEPEATPAASGGSTATAQFDYEAAEDNGAYLSRTSQRRFPCMV
jgi:hypothetical protein